MAAVKKRYQGPTDARRSPTPDIKVSDQVYIKAKYFRSTQPSKKLSKKNLGPYPIITQVGILSFTICLPDSMCAVHPIFHISQLEPVMPNIILNWSQPPPPPVKVDGKPKYEITKILDSKLDWQRRQCPLLYLVQWADYNLVLATLVTDLFVLLCFLPPHSNVVTMVANTSLSLCFSPLADLFIVAVNTSK